MLQQKNKRIIVIGGIKSIFDRAKKMGLEVFHIQKPQLFQSDVLPLVDRLVLTDYECDSSLLPALESIHAITPFDACITFTEKALLLSSVINQKLGLPGHDPKIVTVTNDKYEMRKILEKHQFSQVHFTIGNSPDDIVAFGRRYGYPLILKPKNGVGSSGIYYLKNEEQVHCLELSGEFLIEEYLEGPEFSVEAFSFDGYHTIFAVTEKTTLPADHEGRFVEVAHRIPAAIPSEIEQSIKQYVKEFLQIIGVQNGPTHTEIKLTPKGLRIIETHTRPGGDFIPDLVQLSTGYDLYSLTLGWYCGLVEPILEPAQPIGGAAIRFFVPPSGKVKSIIGVEEALSNRGVSRVSVEVKVGDQIPKIKSSFDRVGYVMAIGDSAQEASKICEEVTRQVQFVVSHD